MISRRRSQSLDFQLCLLGTVLVIVGCFGPWVPHRAAALTITGYELAEFAKFFPEVQGGVISINRPLFYFPFVVALLLVAYLAGQSATRSVRLVVPLIVAGLFLAALFPYSAVDGVRHALASRSPMTFDPNTMERLMLALVGIALALVAPLAHRLSPRVQGSAVALMALVGVAPALWQFALLRPLIVKLYDAPLGPGWGVIVCGIGAALLLFSGIRMASGDETGA